MRPITTPITVSARLPGASLVLLLCSCSNSELPLIQPEAAWNRLIEVEAGVGEHIALIGPKIPIHPAFADAVTDAEYDADRLRLLEAVRDTKNFGFSAHRLTFTALAPGETDVELVIRRADASPASEPDSEPRARYRIRVSR